ncbi:MAG: histidine phosphatase family protein [Acidimicrobiia bacterium]
MRHAETDANVAGRWFGHTDSPLSPAGEHQAALLGRRLAGRHFDLVVASDLGRTRATAAALGRDFEVDARWREPFVGDWETLTTEEIQQRWSGDLHAVFAGEDVPLGGGERLSEVAVRQLAAYNELLERIGDGTALVVGHGLALLTLATVLLETRLPSPLGLMSNTALTTFRTEGDRRRLPHYNDATHVADPPSSDAGAATEIVLIRHGRTAANEQGRWQGQTDGGLTATGRDQARRLAAHLAPLDAIYTSPLGRARETAQIVAAPHDTSLQIVDDLVEIGFGTWEGHTKEEIAAADPDLMTRLAGGEDVVRGGTGETFASVGARMRDAIERIAAAHPGGRVGVVSHGGASRAYAAGVLGIGFPLRGRLTLLANTGYARLAIGGPWPSLLSWNLAPHLEE